MTKRLNVGFIGCGRIADLHYLGYKERKDAKLYAVCDLDKDLAEARKKEWNTVKAYNDYKQMLADPELDAVEIIVPHSNNLHERVVIDAARAGKHIAVQKPMATSLKSADRMLQEAAKSGVVYKVTENYVFYPPILKAKEMIESGMIGEPISVRIKFISGSSGGWKVPVEAWQWRVQELLEGRGTATFDHGHHLWSTAFFLLGNVERVNAWIDQTTFGIDCPAIVMWKYKDSSRYGVCDFVHSQNLHIPGDYYANDEWIEINGSSGLIMIDRCSAKIQQGPVMRFFNGKSMTAITEVESDWATGFVGATNNFIRSIYGEDRVLLSGDEAREVLRFALAVQHSAKKRREVYLDELDSFLPSFYAATKRVGRALENMKIPGLSLFNEDLSKYAPEARKLTEKILGGFDASVAQGWDITIGVHLTEDGGVKEERISIIIRDGKLNLNFGELPENATLSVQVATGVWGAILLRKKRPEVAFLQGKIKVEGQIEEGLKLRELFKF
ncbi:MAG: Gfo/Idh/MocA family oxidoreductase [Blastocatellia bacterium]|nr:Gfo/Idh/MocA family oxidoreductase [Blastocatellia bacterium]